MQRPTSVSIFGILNMVFACLGVLGTLGSIAMFYLPGNSNNPVIKIMQENPSYAAFIKLSIPLGFLNSIILLTAGIGLLNLKNWARLLSIGYAIYAIVFALLSMALNIIFVMRPLLEQASQRQGPEEAGAIGGAIGGSVGGCFALVYPILLLIFMTRPKLVAAFQPPQSGSVPPPPISP
jgi:hypothetical protein